MIVKVIHPLQACSNGILRSCAAVDVAVVGCDREAAGCSQLCVSSSTGQSPRCTCVPGYTLDSDGTGCVADTWAIPGVILVYNEAGKLQAANLSALTSDDDTERRRRSRSSVQLHRSNSRIDAIGTNIHSLTPTYCQFLTYCFHCRLLWPPYVMGGGIIFLPCSFFPSFYLLHFFPRLI